MNSENTNNSYTQTPWEAQALEYFGIIMQEIPTMIRGIAETRVSKKAEQLCLDEQRQEISIKDMIDAFFAETPGGFVGQMKASMDKLGIDYGEYGYV